MRRIEAFNNYIAALYYVGMVYINWPDDVNMTILDSTSLTVGDGATVEDEADGGRKLVRLKTSSCPDTHQVSMDFNWTEKDENGLTEWDRFWLWYKEKHRYGTRPFVFPTIVLASTIIGKKSVYRIMGAVAAQKYGTSVKVSMNWEEVPQGDRQAAIKGGALDHIAIYTAETQEKNADGTPLYTHRIDCIFDGIPLDDDGNDRTPLLSEFVVKQDDALCFKTRGNWDTGTFRAVYRIWVALWNGHTVEVTWDKQTAYCIPPQ